MAKIDMYRRMNDYLNAAGDSLEFFQYWLTQSAPVLHTSHYISSQSAPILLKLNYKSQFFYECNAWINAWNAAQLHYHCINHGSHNTVTALENCDLNCSVCFLTTKVRYESQAVYHRRCTSEMRIMQYNRAIKLPIELRFMQYVHFHLV